MNISINKQLTDTWQSFQSLLVASGYPVICIIILLYWRYIVTFTLYHSWVHPIHHSPLFPYAVIFLEHTKVILTDFYILTSGRYVENCTRTSQLCCQAKLYCTQAQAKHTDQGKNLHPIQRNLTSQQVKLTFESIFLPPTPENSVVACQYVSKLNVVSSIHFGDYKR
jgi:hypothetical protein